MLHASLIFIGLSLDSFVAMMHKGATVRDLHLKDILLYSLLYALISAAQFLLGFGVSVLFKDILPGSRVQIGIAALIILTVGNYIFIKSSRKQDFDEKLDLDFNWKSFCRLAVMTNVTTFFVGIGFSLLSISLGNAVLLISIVSFLTAFVSLQVGYYNGAGFERAAGMSGGALMIVFALYFMLRYVLR